MVEVDRVIDDKVELLRRRRRLLEDECQHLKTLLRANLNRTYLWVILVLDVVEHTPGLSPGKLEQKVNHLPAKVEDAYESMLRKSVDETKAQKALELVLAARRPLTIQQMRDALTIDERHKSLGDLENNLEPLDRFKDTLKDISGLLLVFRIRKGFLNIFDSICTEQVEEVHLLHQTVRDFLIKPTQGMNLVGINETDYDGRTALHWAVKGNAARLVRLLLSNETTEVDLGDIHGDTPLQLAFKAGYTNFVALLCATGKADANRQYSRLSKSFLRQSLDDLYWADVKDKKEPVTMIESLLRAEGLDTNAPLEDGQTVLMHTASRGLLEGASLLLSHGNTNINATDNAGRTALTWAIKTDSIYHLNNDMARLLLTHSKADTMYEQELFLESLKMAIELGRVEITRTMLASDMFRAVNAVRSLSFALTSKRKLEQEPNPAQRKPYGKYRFSWEHPDWQRRERKRREEAIALVFTFLKDASVWDRTPPRNTHWGTDAFVGSAARTRPAKRRKSF
ncbi:uncharacterized protein N0V89_003442 [Didymosphaeria variabile]|uniref:Ankyrin n=1 Tax=Didymosphaeria variabile TaxID=1932322 RepID=A0A9W8XPA5_9PLEO|nr:uncharacterized protein N0V89_003442 [Didymosphaeria variabile]KAJ4355426.1 hypothetical protein N0V89_003442 [Didymosphaeria variabile]